MSVTELDTIEKFDPYADIEGEVIPYCQVNTEVIKNITNPIAGFVWVYLLSKPKNWMVVKKHIQNHFGIGQDKCKEVFAYLRKHNLIEYVRGRNELNQYTATKIRVLNGSKFIKPESISCNTVEATGGLSTPLVIHTCGKPHTTKNRTIQSKDIKIKALVQPAVEPDRFDEFWKAYPRKEGKLKAKKAWKANHSEPMADQLIQDVQNRVQHCAQWQDKQYIPMASTYLNGERWNDEIVKASPPPPKPLNLAQVPRSTNGYGNMYDVTEARLAREKEALNGQKAPRPVTTDQPRGNDMRSAKDYFLS